MLGNTSKAAHIAHRKIPILKNPQPFIVFFAFAFFFSLALVSNAEPAEPESSTSRWNGVKATAVDQSRRREVGKSPSQTDQNVDEDVEDNCD